MTVVVIVVVMAVVVVTMAGVVTMAEMDVPWRNKEIERKAVVLTLLRLLPTKMGIMVNMEIMVTETMIREA